LPLFLRYCHNFYGIIATIFTVKILKKLCKSHTIHGTNATTKKKTGFYIAFIKYLLYNALGGQENEQIRKR
jgi:hypothetical protein